MNYRPYPDVARAVARLKRGRELESHGVAWIDEHLLPGLLEWQKAIVTHAAKQTGKAAIVAAVVDQAVEADEHVHVATRDGVRCAGGDDACALPATEPAALRPARHCPGFPTRCPNLRPVAPDPPNHYGGTRCGCGDADSGTVKATEAADNLVAFIRARLDEDEYIARRAANYDDGAGHDVQGPKGTWVCLDESEWFGTSYRGGTIGPRIGYANAPELGAHIVAHDPARVLAEVEAKRRIIELHSVSEGHECSTRDRHGDIDHCTWVMDSEACTTLRLLALQYAAHPDYREEWRP